MASEHCHNWIHYGSLNSKLNIKIYPRTDKLRSGLNNAVYISDECIVSENDTECVFFALILDTGKTQLKIISVKLLNKGNLENLH